MSEWISVKDRLPEEQGNYLTHCYGNIEVQRFGFRYEAGKRITEKMDWNEHGYSYLTSHWMPLPEPPK